MAGYGSGEKGYLRVYAHDPVCPVILDYAFLCLQRACIEDHTLGTVFIDCAPNQLGFRVLLSANSTLVVLRHEGVLQLGLGVGEVEAILWMVGDLGGREDNGRCCCPDPVNPVLADGAPLHVSKAVCDEDTVSRLS